MKHTSLRSFVAYDFSAIALNSIPFRGKPNTTPSGVDYLFLRRFFIIGYQIIPKATTYNPGEIANTIFSASLSPKKTIHKRKNNMVLPSPRAAQENTILPIKPSSICLSLLASTTIRSNFPNLRLLLLSFLLRIAILLLNPKTLHVQILCPLTIRPPFISSNLNSIKPIANQNCYARRVH